MVDDPSNIERRMVWAVVLRGAYVASSRLVASGQGPAIMYTPAIASLANILREVVHFAREAGDKVQTKVLASEAEFRAEKDKAKQRKKASSVLGIAATKEQKVPLE